MSSYIFDCLLCLNCLGGACTDEATDNVVYRPVIHPRNGRDSSIFRRRNFLFHASSFSREHFIVRKLGGLNSFWSVGREKENASFDDKFHQFHTKKEQVVKVHFVILL